MEVRNNVDVGCASIWRKQRGWEGGRDEQMGGRKPVNKVEGEEKLFCQMHSCFRARERLFAKEELGTCRWQLHHRRWSQREEKSHSCQQAVSVCAAGSPLHKGFQTADPMSTAGPRGCGDVVTPSIRAQWGPGGSRCYILMSHLAEMVKKARREYHVLLPSSLVAVAQGVGSGELDK